MADEGLVEAAQSGDRVRLLTALRDQLAREIRSPGLQSVAGLARELRATAAELSSLGAGTVDAVDEMAAKRAERLAKLGGA